MAQTTTEWLQQSRLTVVSVDPEGRRVRVRGHDEACTDLTCGQEAVVLAEDGPAELAALHPGDIIRIDGRDGRAERIVVVRRVWDELTSPEF